MRYIGVDLHSNNFMVCVLSENEEPTFKKYELAKLVEFKEFLQAEDRIAVEATGTTRFFYNQVAPLVTECVVVNPSRFEISKKNSLFSDDPRSKADGAFARKLVGQSTDYHEFLRKNLRPFRATKETHAASRRGILLD